MDDETIQFEEMHAEELADVLAGEGLDISDEQAAMLKRLLEETGGLDGALGALTALAKIKDAA